MSSGDLVEVYSPNNFSARRSWWAALQSPSRSCRLWQCSWTIVVKVKSCRQIHMRRHLCIVVSLIELLRSSTHTLMRFQSFWYFQ
jgi:hypothetical protein